MAIAVPLIAAGATIISGIMNYMSTKHANQTNLGLAEQEQAQSNKLAAQNYALSTRIQNFNELQAKLDRQDAQEKENYAKQNNAYQRAQNILNQQLSQNQNLNAIFRGRTKQ